jgi:hypothetical protein
MIVIICPNDQGDNQVFGPFPDVDSAMAWASERWGIIGNWHWLPLTQP